MGAAVPITEFVDAREKEEVARLSNADPDAYTRPLRGRWGQSKQLSTYMLICVSYIGTQVGRSRRAHDECARGWEYLV